jgi:hypothetical protein
MNPLSCTAPLKVSTLISADFRDGSLKIAAFTFVVINESSMYSPVPSVLGPDVQAAANTSANMPTDLAIVFIVIMI